MKVGKRLFLKATFIFLFIASFSHGQNSNPIIKDSVFNMVREEISWDLAFAFKTQNYFRGLLISKAPTFSTQAGFLWKDLIVGMYGGVGFDGNYQETDFILVYRKPRFNIHLEYYYNFTEGITDIPEPTGIFDFDPKTTRGLLDLIINVHLDKKKHWGLSSSTFLFGRDTNFGQEIVGNDTTTVRTNQRYTQYLQVNYTWYFESSKVQAHIGAAFSWSNPSAAHFYASTAGISDVGIAYTKRFKFGDGVTIPVQASAFLNPLLQTTYLILTINLIQLSRL